MTLKRRVARLETRLGSDDPEALRQFLISVMGTPENLLVPPGLSLRKLLQAAQGTGLKPKIEKEVSI